MRVKLIAKYSTNTQAWPALVKPGTFRSRMPLIHLLRVRDSWLFWGIIYLAVEMKGVGNTLVFFDRGPCKISPTKWNIEITARSPSMEAAK